MLKSVADGRESNLLTVGYFTAMLPHICIIPAPNDSAYDSARHGQNQGKKKKF